MAPDIRAGAGIALACLAAPRPVRAVASVSSRPGPTIEWRNSWPAWEPI